MRLLITSKSPTGINKGNVCGFSRRFLLRDLISHASRVKPVLWGKDRVAEKSQGVLRERKKEGGPKEMEFQDVPSGRSLYGVIIIQ